MSGEMLNPGQQIKAVLEIDEVQQLLETRYGIGTHTIVELDAYDDRNYRVELPDGAESDNPHIPVLAEHGYILKIINSLDSKNWDFYRAQTELLLFLTERGVCCPIPVKQKDGNYFSLEVLKSGEKHILRLLVFQPGQILGKLDNVSAGLLEDLGRFVATLNLLLKDFSHEGYDDRTSLWVLEAVPKLHDFLFAVKNKDDREFVVDIIQEFERQVLPIYDGLDKGLIHGDLNESNILVSGDGEQIAGIIDFGDSHKNCYVFELAVCLCYMIVRVNDIGMAKHVIDGYKSVRPLTAKERQILKLCVCARLAQSSVLGAYSHSQEPGNLYLIRDTEIKWLLLKKLWCIDDDEITDLWSIGEKDCF